MQETPRFNLDKKDLLDLYKTTVEEHRSCALDHHTRVVWFVGIIATLGVATLAGVFKASTWYHSFVLLGGPVSMIMVCSIAIWGTERIYQRMLETISFRAKLEYRLGFMKGSDRSGGDSGKLVWLIKEPMVPPRHITDSEEADGTETWKRKFLASGRGYHRLAVRLFEQARILSVVLLVAIALKAIHLLVLMHTHIL